jgi:hypothetical protein
MIINSGGAGDNGGFHGQEGTITGKACPKGLYGIFCEVCSTVFYFFILFYLFMYLFIFSLIFA